MKIISIVTIVIMLVIGVSWVVNFVKLTDCDFQSDYKCEAIHAVGIVPPFAPVTVWFDTDAK